MEYDCSCGNNYLFVDPLCQGEVIEKLETAIEGIITERNEKAEDSLAIIKMVLKGVSSISKFMPDFGENFVTSLEMDVPVDAEDIPYFVENPLLTDLHEYVHWNQSTSTESADCEKCELIDHKISVILSFGFFLLGMCRYSERDLIKKIIYLLAPFRRRHREIDKFYDKVWKLSIESKLCSSLYNHIVTFYRQPIEEILSDLISKLSTKEMSITTLPYEESYRNLLKAARKSKNVVCFVTENIAQRFLETRGPKEISPVDGEESKAVIPSSNSISVLKKKMPKVGE
uniref:Uncharacterized protein n=1 Tax=Lutzomyia longipalpis TaxID=7200 RepID=A0A1B0C9V9_LUTLO